MENTTFGELLELEREGWDSLCEGTGGAFYGRVMSEAGVMVLAHGQALTRSEVVASLHEAPGWDSYELSEQRLVEAGPGAAALVYRARARRAGQEPFEALMASVYALVEGQWRLVVYTQTPVPPS